MKEGHLEVEVEKKYSEMNLEVEEEEWNFELEGFWVE